MCEATSALYCSHHCLLDCQISWKTRPYTWTSAYWMTTFLHEFVVQPRVVCRQLWHLLQVQTSWFCIIACTVAAKRLSIWATHCRWSSQLPNLSACQSVFSSQESSETGLSYRSCSNWWDLKERTLSTDFCGTS